jgi:tripartite-type tricarboxylate transporter receptor subunit TctC
MPDVPTLKEIGYGDVDLKFWFTLQVPAKTPADVVERLRNATARAVQQKGYMEGLIARGAEPFYVAPSEVAAFVKKDSEQWLSAARTIGIKPE